MHYIVDSTFLPKLNDLWTAKTTVPSLWIFHKWLPLCTKCHLRRGRKRFYQLFIYLTSPAACYLSQSVASSAALGYESLSQTSYWSQDNVSTDRLSSGRPVTLSTKRGGFVRQDICHTNPFWLGHTMECCVMCRCTCFRVICSNTSQKKLAKLICL